MPNSKKTDLSVLVSTQVRNIYELKKQIMLLREQNELLSRYNHRLIAELSQEKLDQWEKDKKSIPKFSKNNAARKSSKAR